MRLKTSPFTSGVAQSMHPAGDRSRHSAASGNELFMPFAIDLPYPLFFGLIEAVLKEPAPMASLVSRRRLRRLLLPLRNVYLHFVHNIICTTLIVRYVKGHP
jgi:hypothetical protein